MRNINNIVYKNVIPVHYSSEVRATVYMQKMTFEKKPLNEWFKTEFFELVKEDTRKLFEIRKAYEKALSLF